MSSRPPRAVLMMRPAAFGFNRETAGTNAFQRDDAGFEASEISERARHEFEDLAAALRGRGVHVVCLDDTPAPPKPDAVFPNNWVSFHAEGDAILYPMLAPNRRAEARLEVLDTLADEHGLHWPRVHDLRDPAVLGGVLEGTGSLVLDRRSRIAYASLSARTEPAAVRSFCRRFDYEPVVFRARHEGGLGVYHTNVVMALGERFAVVCVDALDDAAERRTLLSRLEATEHEIVPISADQMARFAGNVLELSNARNERLLIASASALDALDDTMRGRLARHAEFVTAPLPTIERYGGGSARCMLVELEGATDPPLNAVGSV